MLGNFNSYFDTFTSLEAHISHGSEIDTVRKARRGEIDQFRGAFRQIPERNKEEFIDAIVDMFSFESSTDSIMKKMKDIYNIPEVGKYLQKMSSEMERFDEKQQIDIVKESNKHTLKDLAFLEERLKDILHNPGEVPLGVLVLSMQTVHLSRLALTLAVLEIERKGKPSREVNFIHSYLFITLARLDAFRRGKVDEDTIHEGLSYLTIILSNEDIELLEMHLDAAEAAYTIA